jgi:hypothetical protein
MRSVVTCFYPIGSLIPMDQINILIDKINEIGINSFRYQIQAGRFPEFAYAYIHPCDEMLETPMFSEIQECYIAEYT